MKKLLFLSCFFIVFAKLSFGQSPFTNGRPIDNAQTILQENGAFKALLGFIPPTLDTLNNPASTYYGALTVSPMYPGKLFMSIQTKWVEVSGSTNITFPGTTGKYLTGYNNVFGTLNTDSITEAGKLFYTTSRARSAISVLSPLVYNSTTGVASLDTSIVGTKTDLLSRWGINGNTGTSSSNFLGTTDNQSLKFKVNNTAYGFLGANITTGNAGSNTALGYRTLSSITTGQINTAFGTDALWLNTSGRQNTAFGARALTVNTTGQNNVAVGDEALQANNGLANTAVGSQALYNTTSGGSNIGVGGQALFNGTTGSNNTAIGYQSLGSIDVGSNNTAIGTNAGPGVTTTNNGGVYIGYQAGFNETKSNKLYIANTSTTTPLIYGNFSNPNVSINSGATADTISAILSIRGLKGVLFPRMNTAQAWAIGGGKTLSNIAIGTMVYNTDSGGICIKIPGVDSIWSKFAISTGGSAGTGTVNNVATGYGLSGGPITNTGTLLWDSATAYLTSVRRKDSTITFATPTQLAAKQASITLTTTGTSGAASLVGPVLNIPQYAGGSPNTNIGTGVSFGVNGTNNIKKAANGFAVLIDSTTTANTVTFKVDTTLAATRARVAQAIQDSLNANIFTISHALQAANYDSLFYIIDPTHIKFVKLTGGSSPIVLTQGSDTSIGFSMPSFVPTSGKVLTLDNSLELSGTDGTIMTFPGSSTTLGGLGTNQTWTGENTFTSSSATNNTINRLRSGADNANSNFVYQSPASIANQTDSRSVPTGIVGLSYRVNFAGVNSTVTADYIYANVNLAKVGFTSAATGTSAKGGTNLLIQSPPFVNGGTPTNSLSNLYVYGKPSFTGTGTDSVWSAFIKGTVYITDTAWGKTMTATQNDSTLATTRFVHAAIAAGGSLIAATNIITSNVQILNTASSTTENVIYTGTIPANSIGVNGHFDVLGLTSFPTSTNHKIFRIKFGATTVLSRDISVASVADRWFFSMFNRNSLSAQIAPGGGGGQIVQGGTSSTALSTTSFNTGADITVTITIQNDTAGESATTGLQAFTVVAYP